MPTDRVTTPLALVTPWWSESATGGAEFLARELAHRLHGHGYAVEVLTTCSRSAFHDWGRDDFEPGVANEDGLVVRRFSVDPRDADRFARLYRMLDSRQALSPAEEKDFFAHGINSRALVRFIEENRARYLFLFLPYLYGTTVQGAPAAGDRAIVIPCLHNEPIAYLGPIAEMMGSVRGLWFLSEPEYYFARTLYTLPRVETHVVGAGMDFCERGDGAAFRRQYGIEGPCLLYAGRRVSGKGFDLLLDCFRRFAPNHPDWTLVLAGPGDTLPANATPARVLDLGCIDQRMLWNAMAGATVFCQPSYYESFSYVLMEAWVQETPALVNARCEVLRWHCERAGGGLWFGDPAEFEACLEWYAGHPEERRAIGRQGAEYVQKQFRWPDVLARAERLFEACSR
jgi:glycosyltransferase involved in cell wall biosynthesis